MDNITPLHELAEKTVEEQLFLFKPHDATRMQSRYFGRSSADVPSYPSPGVDIDYYAATTPTDELKMIIRDDAGDTIAVFFSKTGSPRLPAKRGMVRFVWDMRRRAAGESGQSMGRGGRGPLVSPGKYNVTLTDGRFERSALFTILMDPRIKADGVTIADLREQEKLLQKIAALRSSAELLLKDLKQKIEVLESSERSGIGGNRSRRRLKSLREIQERLVTAAGPYPQPKIIDQISYLSGMLSRADQKPGRDAYLRYEELSKDVKRCRDEIKALTGEQ